MLRRGGLYASPFDCLGNDSADSFIYECRRGAPRLVDGRHSIQQISIGSLMAIADLANIDASSSIGILPAMAALGRYPSWRVCGCLVYALISIVNERSSPPFCEYFRSTYKCVLSLFLLYTSRRHHLLLLDALSEQLYEWGRFCSFCSPSRRLTITSLGA